MFTPSTAFSDCTENTTTPQLQEICENIVSAQLRSEEVYVDFAANFEMFWILFQTLFLGLVIVALLKWFWRIIW